MQQRHSYKAIPLWICESTFVFVATNLLSIGQLEKPTCSSTASLGRHGSALIRFEANGQARRAVHVQSLARLPWLIGGQFEILEPLQQIRERDSGFHARERCPQTKVNAVAEGNVRIGIASDIEAARLGE